MLASHSAAVKCGSGPSARKECVVPRRLPHLAIYFLTTLDVIDAMTSDAILN